MFFVRYENNKCRKISCDIAQGSILGPLLFLMDINNLFRSSNKLTLIMFVDDTNLFISNSKIENLFETIIEELIKVATWFKANKLSLNIYKTNCSLFQSTRKRKDIRNILTPLHIGNVPIEREFVTKFLGLHLDENISWKHHINIVSKRVCKSIGIFYRTNCTLSKFLQNQLYFSFVNCYLNYTSIAWASTNKSKLQTLYRHQKHAARIISFKDKLTSANHYLNKSMQRQCIKWMYCSDTLIYVSL